MKENTSPLRGARTVLLCMLAFVLAAACLTLSGCFTDEGELEDEFSRGYAAGEAAARAQLVGDQESLASEESQGVLAAVGEGRAVNLELKEYTVEGDTCRAYGTMALNDGNTIYVSLLLEKKDGIWTITELGQASAGEEPRQ
jgi:predicted small secreted protein